LRTWVGPTNHVLEGGPDPSMKRQFLGKGGSYDKIHLTSIISKTVRDTMMVSMEVE